MLELDHDLLALLPPWYREILDYQAICRTEEEQLDALAAGIAGVADNFFFQTMDENAVSLWERIFKISPDLQTETLSFRRTRLLTRISSRPPFTLPFLSQKLDELIGPGRWTISVDYLNYALYIESAAENQFYATEVAFTVGKIKPAHIVYFNRPFISSGVLLSEEIGRTERDHNYKLGAWRMGPLPFVTNREGEVFKMADTPSVQTALLDGTASFVSGDIAAARINGAVVISGLSKSVSGSVLTVTYSVTAAQAPEITQTELLDAEGSALTASAVYVPVQEAVTIKHTIKISEGVKDDG